MSLDKAALLALFAPKIIDKPVEGIGNVRLRELSAPEVSAIREACTPEDRRADFGLLLLIAALVDDAGAPVFTADDLPSIRGSAQVRISELVGVVMEVNGFRIKEDAVKN